MMSSVAYQLDEHLHQVFFDCAAQAAIVEHHDLLSILTQILLECH